MKKVFNKTFAAIMLAIVMVLALFSGLFFAGHGEVASADGEDVTIKLQADTKSFSKGTKFDLSVIVSTNLANCTFRAIEFNVGVTNAAKDGYDATKCAQFTLGAPTNEIDEGMSEFYTINRSLSLMGCTDNTTITSSGYDTKGWALISVANDSGISIPCDEELEFKFSLTIANDVADETQFEIGLAQVNLNVYAYQPNGTTDQIQVNASETSKFAIQPLAFTVREPKKDNNLSSIKVGQSDNEGDLQTLTMSGTDLVAFVTDPLKPIYIMPTASDSEGATIKIKKTSDSTDDGKVVDSGKISSFELPADGKLSIIVTAEDGTSTKTYNLTVNMVGAVLTALTAKSDTKVTGVTEGLVETFDSKTLAYTVIVPSDFTKVSITATVSTGNSAKNTVALSKTGSCTIPSTGTSGTAFDVTGIADGDTLTIKAQADNGAGYESETAYVLTFDVKSVDTAITLSVVGKDTGTNFNNDATKATEKSVDYFYVVKGENNGACNVTVTYPTSADCTLDSSDYAGTKLLPAGTHIVVVTAEAGNTKTYKFILKAYTPLQLKSGIVADFIYEELTASNAYRRTYKEKGLEHGKDDLDFDKLVLGQIKDYTPINTFLKNFDSSLHNSLKLYKADGTLVYDKGTATGGFTTADLDNTDKGVGTSWKLEYIVDNAVEETIYLSVLGDLNCDGKVTALDIAAIGRVIQEIQVSVEQFRANVELRLAAYISNSSVLSNGYPKVQASEIPLIGDHIRTVKFLDKYFYTV